jgi:hypothetical protein
MPIATLVARIGAVALAALPVSGLPSGTVDLLIAPRVEPAPPSPVLWPERTRQRMRADLDRLVGCGHGPQYGEQICAIRPYAQNVVFYPVDGGPVTSIEMWIAVGERRGDREHRVDMVPLATKLAGYFLPEWKRPGPWLAKSMSAEQVRLAAPCVRIARVGDIYFVVDYLGTMRNGVNYVQITITRNKAFLTANMKHWDLYCDKGMGFGRISVDRF